MNFLIIIDNEEYIGNVLKIMEEIYEKNDEKILYISLERPYRSLEMDFFKGGIEKDKFVVIDAISKRVIPDVKNTSNCYYVQSPTSFKEIFSVIDYLSKEYKFDNVIFDSVSSLLIYSQEDTAVKFVHELASKVSLVTECEGSFLCVKSDKSKGFVAEIESVFDKVIDLGK